MISHHLTIKISSTTYFWGSHSPKHNFLSNFLLWKGSRKHPRKVCCSNTEVYEYTKTISCHEILGFFFLFYSPLRCHNNVTIQITWILKTFFQLFAFTSAIIELTFFFNLIARVTRTWSRKKVKVTSR